MERTVVVTGGAGYIGSHSLISNWEGLPIGIIEGLRAELPILVSDVGENSKCIKNNGYLVERQNIKTVRISSEYYGKTDLTYLNSGKTAENIVKKVLYETK